MRFIPVSIVFVGVLFPAYASPAPLEQYLPADTELLIQVADLPQMVDVWPDTPFGRLFSDPGFTELLEHLGDEGEEIPEDGYLGFFLREQMDMSLSQLLEPLSGEAAVYARNLVPALREGGTGLKWGLAVEVSDEGATLNLALQRLLEKEGEPPVRVEGDGFARWAPPNEDRAPVWGVAEGRWIMADSDEEWTGLATRLAAPAADDRLGSTAGFRKALDTMQARDAVAYIDLKGFAHMILEAAQEEGLDEQGLDPEQIVTGLGLDAWECLFVSGSLTREKTVVESGFLYSEDRGLTQVYAYLPGPAPRLEFLPDDALGAGTAKYDLARSFAAMQSLLYDASPMLGLVLETQIQTMTAQMGIDLEEDVLQHLGDTTFFTYFPGTPGAGALHEFGLHQIFGCSLTNAKALNQALERAAEAANREAGNITVSRAHGATLYEFPSVDAPGGEGPAAEISLAVTPDYVVISLGSRADLERMLKQMQKPAASLWAKPEVKPLVADVPAGASQLAYYDGAGLVRWWLQAYWSEVGRELDAPVKDMVPQFRRMASHFGAMVGHGAKDDRGMTFRATMNHPD